MIAIVDYGMGNLYSVSKAVERLGYPGEVTGDPAAIVAADKIILPGVGAFGDAMANLKASGLVEPLLQAAKRGVPLLGICLGMQLLFTRSEEHGEHQGLDLLPGRVVRITGDVKVPHMGWNRLQFRQSSPMLADMPEDYVYFVHSYRAIPDRPEHLLAATDYAGEVTAIAGRDNIYGMQFHPEKSGQLGMRLLERFLALPVTTTAEGART